MSVNSAFNKLYEEMEARSERLSASIADRIHELGAMTWADAPTISEPAGREAADGCTFFMLGIGRRLISKSRNLESALAVTSVLTNQNVMETLQGLIHVAYIRGAAKALELTGQTLPTPEPVSTTGSTTEPCPHCGLVHPAGDQHDLTGRAAQMSRTLNDISRVLGMPEISALEELLQQHPASQG